MAQYTSYDTVGQKEDVSDVISNITPTKTPFQSMIGNDKTKAKLFEWQEDELASVRDNAQVEGFTAQDATLTATVMRDNVTQILEKTVKISATNDAIDQYGRAKETSYQLAKASAELKRDLEHAMVGTGQTKVSGATSTARKFAGYQAMVDTSVTVTADSDGAGAADDLQESHVLDAGQALYDAGAEASILMIKPSDSLKVANFAYAAGRSRDLGNTKKVVQAVDLYVGPFGEHRVVMNRFQRATDALLFDPQMWKKVTLRPWTRETLAKDGDNTKHMIVGEFSMKHRNFKGSALITNLK